MAAYRSFNATFKNSLQKAAEIGDIETVRQLLESKICDANERTDTVGLGLLVPVDRTPLHYAATGGHCDIAALLIQHGADPCRVTWDGQTPLHFAATAGHCDIAALLIQHGADPSGANKGGQTPLHSAAFGGHSDVAALLIQHGADPSRYSVDARSPLFDAAMGGHCDVVTLLIQHGADPCSMNWMRVTPLHDAAMGGHRDVAALLIQHGADPCSEDWFGLKPSDLAQEAGYDVLCLLLRKFESDQIRKFMITRTLEHVSAEMSLDDFFLPTDGIINNFPVEVQKQKVQRLKKWAHSKKFKTIQGIKAGLTAQGREKLCVIAAERYANVAKVITDMSWKRYESLREDLSTAQFMFQELPIPALEAQSQEISMEHESFQYDAFLIHSGEDKPKVEEVLELLESRDIRCCYAPRDFLPGRSILSCIEDAVELSRCTVVMVSENFMKSTWCQHERDVAEVKAKDTEGYSVIPVLLGFKPSDLPSAYKVKKFILADSQDFIPTLVKAIEGPTADPPYGKLRSGYESMKQEVERYKMELQEKSQRLEDSSALIMQLRAKLEATTLSE